MPHVSRIHLACAVALAGFVLHAVRMSRARRFTGRDSVPLLLLCVLFPAVAFAQEKPVPKDSARVQIAGCAHKRTFTVKRPPEGEPVQVEIGPGRQFTMNGKKDTLADIRAHETSMIEITGLVLRADLGAQPGISTGGGRVRISPGNPQAPIYGSPAGDPHYSRAVIDVESWRPLPASCK